MLNWQVSFSSNHCTYCTHWPHVALQITHFNMCAYNCTIHVSIKPLCDCVNKNKNSVILLSVSTWAPHICLLNGSNGQLFISKPSDKQTTLLSLSLTHPITPLVAKPLHYRSLNCQDPITELLPKHYCNKVHIILALTQVHRTSKWHHSWLILCNKGINSIYRKSIASCCQCKPV